MSVIVKTAEPHSLLEKVKEDIRGDAIAEWEIDTDGDFSLAIPDNDAWAWLRPRATKSALIFTILGMKGSTMTKRTYALYHSKFLEMLLEHYDLEFDSATCSAMPTKGDSIGGS